jgi:hypothetical protein
MKKILFVFCCFWAAMSAVRAQHEPIKHSDSLRFYKHAEAVVRDAPFIFKGQEIAQKAIRGKGNEVIAVTQLRIIEVIKGDIAVGDTVEFSYLLGNGIWNNDELAGMESHGQGKEVVWENINKPMYFFCKSYLHKPYFMNTKKTFSLYSERPFSVSGTSDGLWFSYLTFKTEYNFLNYINKILAPKAEVIMPIKVITPLKDKKKKKTSQKKIMNEMGIRQMMPSKVFNIRTTDSSDNLDTYNTAHDGWYAMSVYIQGSLTEASFLKSYQFDIQYDDFYFYPNAATDDTKIKVEMIDIGSLPTCGTAGVNYPFYTQTVTSLGVDKLRVKVTYATIDNGTACNGSNYRLTFGPIILGHNIKFKAVNSAITCMPSVGKIIPNSVIALYDNVTTHNAPATTSTTPYLFPFGR